MNILNQFSKSNTYSDYSVFNILYQNKIKARFINNYAQIQLASYHIMIYLSKSLIVSSKFITIIHGVLREFQTVFKILEINTTFGSNRRETLCNIDIIFKQFQQSHTTFQWNAKECRLCVKLVFYAHILKNLNITFRSNEIF